MQEAQRVLLDVYGYILAKLQGRSPEYGIIRRPKGKSATVSLSRNLKKGESVLNDLFEMQSSMAPPKLFLNLHCQTCQFQKRCRAQAIEEDSLSLLRGISQTEITRLNRKGIFTINQLSYTFRPRKIKKRAKKTITSTLLCTSSACYKGAEDICPRPSKVPAKRHDSLFGHRGNSGYSVVLPYWPPCKPFWRD